MAITHDKVLVTGATGLLGNNIVRHSLAQGISVRALIRTETVPRSLEGLPVETVLGDIRDASSVRKACEGMQAVVHSGALVQIGRTQLKEHLETNTEGARTVARAAAEVGARLVHVSTVDALGLRSTRHPADEDTPLAKPVRCSYVLSKREAEKAVLEEVERGLDAVIVNPGFMLGPWDWKPSSGRMLLEVARGRGLFAPRGYFSSCDARDVAAGTVSAMERGQTGRRYILAGENMTYYQAWRLFGEVTGGRKPIVSVGPLILYTAGMIGDVRGWFGREPDVNTGAIALARLPSYFSSERARTELGYQSRPFRESVQDAWDWFREYGYA